MKLVSNVGGAVRGAAGNATTQGVSMVAGLQGKFDWSGVAVGGVVGASTAWAGGLTGIKDLANAPSFSAAGLTYSSVTGVAGAIAGAATRSLLNGTDFGDNIKAVLPDVIGATIGNAVAGKLASRLASSAQASLSRVPRPYQVASNDSTNAFGKFVSDFDKAQAPTQVEELVVTGRRMSWLEKFRYDVTHPIETFNRIIDPRLQSGGPALGLFAREMANSRIVAALSDASKRPSELQANAFYQPGVRTGTGYDRMGQPLNSRSSYDAVRQFNNIVADAGNTSAGITLRRLGEWGTYTVPDAARLRAESMDPYRGMTPQGRTIAMQLDRLEGGTISGLATGMAIQLGASQRTQDLVYGLGSAADGFLLSGGAMAGARVPGISNQTELRLPQNVGINGNSKLSPRTAYLYELSTAGTADTAGLFLKYGISQNPATRYSTSFMADKRIFPVASGTRTDMLSLERQMATANPGPMNNEPWAVKARTQGAGQ